MENYIGTKLVKAEPMNLGTYNEMKDREIPKDEKPNTQGYIVVYSDNYTSWSPKDVFDEAYRQLEDNNLDDIKSVGLIFNKDYFKNMQEIVRNMTDQNGNRVTLEKVCEVVLLQYFESIIKQVNEKQDGAEVDPSADILNK